MNGHVLFNEGNIWVTGSSFVTGTDTYQIASIRAVDIHQTRQALRVGSAIALAGVGLAVLNLWVGAAILAVGLTFWATQRNYRVMVINVDGQDVTALKSHDMDLLIRIQGALGKALVYRDSPATLPTNYSDA